MQGRARAQASRAKGPCDQWLDRSSSKLCSSVSRRPLAVSRHSSAVGRATPSPVICALNNTGGPPGFQARPLGQQSRSNWAPIQKQQPASAPLNREKLVTVRFWLKYRTSWGQSIKLVGSHPSLGSWVLQKGLDLRWAQNDTWTASVDLPAGGVFEYKYAVIDYATKQAQAWQTGGNSVLALDVDERELDVYDNWGGAGAEIKTEGGLVARDNKLMGWAKRMMSHWREGQAARLELQRCEDEMAGLKSEVARLKMELSLSSQAQAQTSNRLVDLQAQNNQLQQELLQSQVALSSTLQQALHLLADEADTATKLEDDEDYADDVAQGELEENEEDEGPEEAEQAHDPDWAPSMPQHIENGTSARAQPAAPTTAGAALKPPVSARSTPQQPSPRSSSSSNNGNGNGRILALSNAVPAAAAANSFTSSSTGSLPYKAAPTSHVESRGMPLSNGAHSSSPNPAAKPRPTMYWQRSPTTITDTTTLNQYPPPSLYETRVSRNGIVTHNYLQH